MPIQFFQINLRFPATRALSSITFRQEIEDLLEVVTFVSCHDLSVALQGSLVNEEELKELLTSCSNPVAYDGTCECGHFNVWTGFEPVGRMHVAEAIMKKKIIEKLTRCGFTYLVWIADYFAYLRGKLNGNLEKMRTLSTLFISFLLNAIFRPVSN